MTKLKGKLRTVLIVLLSLVAVAALTVGVTFAYFQNTKNQDYTITTAIEGTDYVVTVSDFGDLYTASQSEYYNDINEVSTVTTSTTTDDDGNETTTTTYTYINRKVVALGADITLTNDLRVTADIHINLNGNTLYLNGHTLTIQHAYEGAFAIYSTATNNGSIVATNGGSIVIDTPNASVLIDSTVTVADGLITVLSADFNYTAYSALYMVGEALSSDLEKRPERKTYSKDMTFTNTDFVSEKTYSSTTDVHVFVAVGCDLDLPTHYLSTDYTITYKSGNTNYLSNLGNALSAGDTTLTATVSNSDGTKTASVNFPVHVVNPKADDYDGDGIAQTLIESYLAEYYNETDSQYEFENAIQLPTKDTDLGITINSFTLDDGDDDTTDTTVETDGDQDGFITLEPLNNHKTLTVSVTANGTTDTFTLKIYSTYIPSDEAIARLILTKLYGGAVVYDYTKEEGKNTLTTVSDCTDNNSDSYNEEIATLINSYNVTGISYAITGESDAKNYYTIKHTEATEATDTTEATAESYALNLASTSTTPPYSTESVTCTVKFGSGKSSTVTLKILYVAEGGGASGYLQYYNTYNTQVVSPTSTSFIMPFATDGIYTVYDFAYNYETTTEYTLTSDIVINSSKTYYTRSGDEGSYTYTAVTETDVGNIGTYYEKYTYYVDDDNNSETATNTSLSMKAPEAISLTLAKNVVEDNGNITSYEKINTFAYDGTNTMTTLFDNWLGESSLSAYSSASWIITIDQSKLDFDDVDMLLLYNYKIGSSATTWSAYVDSNSTKYTSSTVTPFTLRGGVYFVSSDDNNEVVKDEKLFSWMRTKYIGSGSEVTFIENSILETPQTIDVTSTTDTVDSMLSGVSDWTGIENLTGLTEANFSGINWTEKYASLVNMQSLQKLVLQNCNLTEDQLSKLFQSGTYKSFPNLRELDVSNSVTATYSNTNSIASFDWITETNFPALERVYIYGNTFTNGYQGSEGMSNYQTFEDLTSLYGVTVYNTTNAANVPVSFENADENSDYARLKALTYQRIIASDTDITTIYAPFAELTTESLHLSGVSLTTPVSTTTTDTTTVSIVWNAEGIYSTTTIAWGYEGSDPKTATYFTATVTASVTLKMITTTTTTTLKYKETSDTTVSSGKTYYTYENENYVKFTGSTFDSETTYYETYTDTVSTSTTFDSEDNDTTTTNNYSITVRYYVDRRASSTSENTSGDT